MFPTRYTDLVEIRKYHGSLADKVAPFFFQGDPQADEADAQLTRLLPAGRGRRIFELVLEKGIDAVPEAPPALRKLFAHLEDTPLWLNRNLLELGARTQLRCGVACGIVLGSGCLPQAYRSGVGSKPLAFTRKLIDQRAVRRLCETNRFFVETCSPGGLERDGAGWKMTVMVRMMHAAMRRWLRKQRWQLNDWGDPINQLDMAATRLLFSVSLLQCLRQIGFHFSAAESEGVMHVWRYSGHLVGVVPDLLCSTETEGRSLLSLLLDLAGTPDPDSVCLARKLLADAMPMLVGSAFLGLLPFGASLGEGMLGKLWARTRQGVSRALGLGASRTDWQSVPPAGPASSTAQAGMLSRPPQVLTAKPTLQVRESMAPSTDAQPAKPSHLARFCYGLSFRLLGSRTARELEYPWTFYRYTARGLLRCVIVPLEICRRFFPGATALAYGLGRNQIRRMMQTKVFARPPSPQGSAPTERKDNARAGWRREEAPA